MRKSAGPKRTFGGSRLLRALIPALAFTAVLAAGTASAQTDAEPAGAGISADAKPDANEDVRDTPAAASRAYPGVFRLGELKDGDSTAGYVWSVPGRESSSASAPGGEPSDAAAGASDDMQKLGGEYGISVTVIRHDDKTDWSYTAFDRNAPGTEWELSAEVKENGRTVPNPRLVAFNDLYDFIEEPLRDDAGNELTDEDGNVLKERKQGKFLLRVYSFSLPVQMTDGRAAPAIAVRNNAANVSSDANRTTGDGLTFYMLSESSLAFGTPPAPDGGEQPEPDAIITIGQPLPSSVVTLLVAFGIGAVLAASRRKRGRKI